MAIPALPTALNTDDVVDNDWVDDVRALLGWFRDDRPIFKGKAWNGNTGDPVADTEVATATSTTFGFGAAGAFISTPDINVGGWTVNAADSDPESLVVPEAGIYLVIISSEWEANATGRRVSSLLVGGSSVTQGRAVHPASPSNITEFTHSVIVDVAASTDLDIDVFQTSGSTLQLTTYLTAVWMQST